MAIHAGVPSILKGVSAVLLGIVEGNSLLQVRSSGSKLPNVVEGASQCPVGFQEERRGMLALGQPEKLLPHLARCL